MTDGAPADVAALMSSLLAADPGRPRVTWYGPGAERVEFSAKTLGNWVSKTANLLVEELDCEPGSTVGIALPVHWRTIAWLLAAWSTGAHVIVFEEDRPPTGTDLQLDVLVTDRPSSPPAGVEQAELVVVALPSLATRWTGDVPAGAIDAAAEIRLQPDHFRAHSRPSPDAPALTVGELTVTYADLLARAAAVTGESAGPRPGAGAGPRFLTGAGPAQAITAYLAPLVAGGSVVLHHDPARLPAADRDHLIAQEQVTAVDAGAAG